MRDDVARHAPRGAARRHSIPKHPRESKCAGIFDARETRPRAICRVVDAGAVIFAGAALAGVVYAMVFAKIDTAG